MFLGGSNSRKKDGMSPQAMKFSPVTTQIWHNSNYLNSKSRDPASFQLLKILKNIPNNRSRQYNVGLENKFQTERDLSSTVWGRSERTITPYNITTSPTSLLLNTTSCLGSLRRNLMNKMYQKDEIEDKKRSKVPTSQVQGVNELKILRNKKLTKKLTKKEDSLVSYPSTENDGHDEDTEKGNDVSYTNIPEEYRICMQHSPSEKQEMVIPSAFIGDFRLPHQELQHKLNKKKEKVKEHQTHSKLKIFSPKWERRENELSEIEEYESSNIMGSLQRAGYSRGSYSKFNLMSNRSPKRAFDGRLNMSPERVKTATNNLRKTYLTRTRIATSRGEISTPKSPSSFDPGTFVNSSSKSKSKSKSKNNPSKSSKLLLNKRTSTSKDNINISSFGGKKCFTIDYNKQSMGEAKTKRRAPVDLVDNLVEKAMKQPESKRSTFSSALLLEDFHERMDSMYPRHSKDLPDYEQHLKLTKNAYKEQLTKYLCSLQRMGTLPLPPHLNMIQKGKWVSNL